MENRIKEALKIRNMKQVELSEKADIHKGALSNWISQHYQPKEEALVKMSKVLNVSEAWLAGFDVPMEVNGGKEFINTLLELTDEVESLKVRRKKELGDAILLLSRSSKEIEKLNGDRKLIEDIELYISNLIKD